MSATAVEALIISCDSLINRFVAMGGTMFRAGRVLLISACFFALHTGDTAAKTLRAWQSHGWHVGAYSDDQTGAFSHCAASIKYQSGILLLFSINRDFTWQIGFANPAWHLARGETYGVRYAVDRSRAINGQAIARNTTLVSMSLPSNNSLFERFRRGHVLYVQGAGRNFQFRLDNTFTVLQQLLSCTREFVAASERVASSSNPFVTGSTATPTTRERRPQPNIPALKAEATTVVANVLSSAGVSGFELMSDIPDEFKFFHAMWGAPGVAGGLTISEDDTISSASTMRIAMAAKECKGTFASGKLPTSAKAARIKTACASNSEDAFEIEHIVLARPKGGVYVFTLVNTALSEESNANSESSGIHERGTRLLNAALRRIN